MKCIICWSDCDDYIECGICHEAICLTCWRELKSIYCKNCKRKFNIFIAADLEADDANTFVDLYVEDKRKNLNQTIKEVTAIVKAIHTRVEHLNIEKVRQYISYMKSIDDILLNTYEQQRFKELAELKVKVKADKKKVEKSKWKQLKKAIRSQLWSDDTVESVAKRAPIIDLQIIEDYLTYYKLKLDTIESESDDDFFGDNDIKFKLAMKTDTAKLKVFISSMENDVDIYFSKNSIDIFPDDEGLEYLKRIKKMLQSKYPEIETFYNDTPVVVLNAYAELHDRDDVKKAIFNATAKQLASKIYNIKELPISICEKCNGQISRDYKCVRCRTKYCKNCMKPLPHECKKEDVAQWTCIRNTTKACPVCGLRIEKKSGCNDMFCKNCHTGFKWDTFEIIEGEFENPERKEWIESVKAETMHLAPTLRQFTIEDQISFFDAVAETAVDKVTSFEYISQAVEAVKELVKDGNPFYGLFDKRVTAIDANDGIFAEEVKWMLTETIISAMNIGEDINDGKTEDCKDKMTEMLKQLLKRLSVLKMINLDVDNTIESVSDAMKHIVKKAIKQATEEDIEINLVAEYMSLASGKKSFSGLIKECLHKLHPTIGEITDASILINGKHYPFDIETATYIENNETVPLNVFYLFRSVIRATTADGCYKIDFRKF